MNPARFTALAALLLIPCAVAQPPEHRRDRILDAAASERDAREMVEVVMMVRLSKELGLSEEETVLLVRRMSEFRDDVQKAQRRRRELMDAIRKAIAEGAEDEAILAHLDELKSIDRRLNNIKLEAHDKLAEGLTVQQQARLYLFLQDFDENMRRMVQRVRERSRMLQGGPSAGRDGMPPRRIMRDGRPDSPPPPRDRGDRPRAPREPGGNAPAERDPGPDAHQSN